MSHGERDEVPEFLPNSGIAGCIHGGIFLLLAAC
jgi:hypothetical protein